MKNKKILLIGLLILTVLTGCASEDKSDKVHSADAKEEKDIQPEEPAVSSDKAETLNYLDEQIVFAVQYTNWSEGYYYSVSYVTANGNVYHYSDQGGYDSEPYQLGDILNFPMEEIQETIVAEEMEELIGYFEKVGDIEFTEECFACDYGQRSVYGVKCDEQNEPQFVYLGSFGDNHRIPNDEYAKKICKYFGVDWD